MTLDKKMKKIELDESARAVIAILERIQQAGDESDNLLTEKFFGAYENLVNNTFNVLEENICLEIENSDNEFADELRDILDKKEYTRNQRTLELKNDCEAFEMYLNILAGNPALHTAAEYKSYLWPQDRLLNTTTDMINGSEVTTYQYFDESKLAVWLSETGELWFEIFDATGAFFMPNDIIPDPINLPGAIPGPE